MQTDRPPSDATGPYGSELASRRTSREPVRSLFDVLRLPPSLNDLVHQEETDADELPLAHLVYIRRVTQRTIEVSLSQ